MVLIIIIIIIIDKYNYPMASIENLPT